MLKSQAETGTNVEGIEQIDPKKSEKAQAYADLLFELRKAKGMTPEQAMELVTGNPLFYGAVMVKTGDADGMVAGAINSTGNVLRPALQIIKTAPGIKVVSGAFIMEVPNKQYGDDGVLIFGDCAVIPDPSADELAAIAISSAQTGKQLTGMDPKVAMLSFSTKGSAKHDNVTKVQEATAKVHELAPELECDGELQADAALGRKRRRAQSARQPGGGSCQCTYFPPICRQATSATNWCSVLRALRRSAPLYRVWPSR